MPQVITVIDLGGANCYLVTSGAGFCLTDTGFVTRRGDLEKALERAGCRLGNLSLVILTHGDLDHAGNAAYLQKKFGSMWRQYIPVVAAGFSCGAGLITMLSVGVTVLSKAVFQLSY